MSPKVVKSCVIGCVCLLVYYLSFHDPFSRPLPQENVPFWERQADCLEWFRRWDTVLEWDPPYAKWFVGGKLNACYNCLDRHMRTETKHKVALFWEGERGETRRVTYEDLFDAVNRFSNALKSLGIKKGDIVAIYLPMIPEAVVAMLSCARIGAVHTVVFGGFSPAALKERILDTEAKLLITANGSFRRGNIIPLQKNADAAIDGCPCVEHVIIVQNIDSEVLAKKDKDLLYHELIEKESNICHPEEMAAEDPLFILYTSGSSGKPKGIVHSTGGYMVQTTQIMQCLFDVQPSDVYWCTGDIGWAIGHCQVVYGPLSNGMTQMIYEGALDFPAEDRWWQLIEKYKVTLFWTVPTAIRMFMKWGPKWLEKYDLSSLRLLGCGGESLNVEAWEWFYEHVGGKRCPIMNSWGQTETGGTLIASLPSKTPPRPGSIGRPMPGIDALIVDDAGEVSSLGHLVLGSPWPSMLRGIHKDSSLYEQTYWGKWQGRYYCTGDGARKEEGECFWLTGREDDVIKVAGHRLGTVEIESALSASSSVIESAVVGVSHPIKGQAIVCFVVLKEGVLWSQEELQLLKESVVNHIGALARPELVLFVKDLPKTRSGKIMRRLLRDIVEGKEIGDIPTLADPSVVEIIRAQFLSRAR